MGCDIGLIGYVSVHTADRDDRNDSGGMSGDYSIVKRGKGPKHKKRVLCTRTGRKENTNKYFHLQELVVTLWSEVKELITSDFEEVQNAIHIYSVAVACEETTTVERLVLW